MKFYSDWAAKDVTNLYDKMNDSGHFLCYLMLLYHLISRR